VTTNLTYDNAGNRLTLVNATANLTYNYDVTNRLESMDDHNATWSNPGTTPAYIFDYDYRSRRLGREGAANVGGYASYTPSRELYDGGAAVRAYTVSGSPVLNAEYIRGSDWGGGVGGILYNLSGSTPSYYHYDGRGDVVALTSNTGTVNYQAAYDSYGTHSASGSKGTQESGTNYDLFRANTKEEYPSGLLNEGQRYRDLATDVFLTRDPAGMIDGPNEYSYVRQNPWTGFDPEGLQTEPMPGPAMIVPLMIEITLVAIIVKVAWENTFHSHPAQQPTYSAPTTPSSPPPTSTPPIIPPAPPPTSTPPQTNSAPAKNPEGFTPAAPLPNSIPGGSTPTLPTPTSTPPQEISPEASQQLTVMEATVNGNSAASTRRQIIYGLFYPEGPIWKYGISGQDGPADVNHPRVKQQTKGTDLVPKIIDVVPEGEGARQKALDIELQKVDEHADQNDGNGPPGNKRPQPSNQGPGGAQ